MITITGQREIAGCNVYCDDVDALGFYIMPQAPRIALDEQGKPIFSLVWYRRDIAELTDEERRTRLGGGLLSLSTELSATDAAMAEIRSTLAADPLLHARLERDLPQFWITEIARDPAKLAAVLKIGMVPVSEGTVTIAVLAETPGAATPVGEFVATLIGVGRVSMTGRQRASFAAKLTLDGAVLLWKMIENDLRAIRVAYDLRFNHRLDAVRMVVWAKADKAYHALQEQWQDLSDDAHWSETHTSRSSTYTYGRDQSNSARNIVSEVLSASELSGVEVIPEGGADVISAEQIAELTKYGEDMLRDFLTSTFLEWKPGEGVKFDDQPTLETELPELHGKKYGHHGIHTYALKKWDDSMSAELNHVYKSKAVVTGNLGPNDNIGNILGGRDVSELRTQIELAADWYKFLDVQVLCTTDFDEDPVDLVKVHLRYEGKGPLGDVLTVKDLVFRKNTPPQRFATYLSELHHRTYSYELEVYYRGVTQTYTTKGQSEETILVLDTDRLGVLRVDIQMGLVDWDRIRQVLVKLSHGVGASRKEVEFALDDKHQSYRWIEVVGGGTSDPYTYQVTYVDRGGQHIVIDPERSRSHTLIFNQPFQEDHEVVLVPAGSFGAGGLLSQVVVSLRYTDPANDYLVEETFTLAKDGESRVWKVPLIDKTLRRYEYRVTVFYSDGVTREDAWKPSDSTILAVGDPYGFRVQILPFLLKNTPEAFLFGTLTLRFDDDVTGIHAERTLELTDFTKPLTWRFRLGAPERHTYRYQLTLFTADGKAHMQAEGEESKDVLVLMPPPPDPTPAPTPTPT